MKRSDRASKAAFWVVVLLSVLDRCHLLSITMGYASDDLTVVWMAARDYAQGIFHEPFFYGQDYGVMLEALLAAPFVRLGADPAVAVPVVMAVLAMLPYWSFAFFEYRRMNLAAAIFIAAIPILLPVEHGLQCTNLNGLAILAFYPWVGGMPLSATRSAWIGTVLAAAAFVNMNALVAVAAFGTFFLLRSVNERRQWLWAACGALPILLLWWWSMHFYSARPEQVVHTVFDWRMVFHASLIPEAISRLDAHFAWLCPLWWPNGHLVLWFLAAVVVALFRKGNKPAAWAIVAALVTILISFGFAKIHDGTMSVLFPLSRMYLVVPLLLGWGIAELGPFARGRQLFIVIITLTSVVTFTLRNERAATVWADTLSDPKGTPLYMEKVTTLREQCRMLEHYAHETSADVIVIVRGTNSGQALFLNMGCPVCEPALPPTYMPDGDRRAWRVEKEALLQRERILVVNGKPEVWAKAKEEGLNVQAIGTGAPMLHLVIGAGLPVDSLMLRLGYGVGQKH